ncbi:MAG: arylesterase [Rhodothermaceae bacterium]|nr:arylesterase [Rhodothermaceae bacterium]MXZ57604.1 arylesterase [Rhodothermaceae bacterium]MYB91264.1 arylesterase [Rhodothermaceae bacterium]MYD68916.1 arylesterase [Rhodothermaceae bacterium]MYG45359.1 arylesterase [Rhodothermaceae bacterium]
MCLCVLLPVRPAVAQNSEGTPIRVLFLGNSLTAGYGLSPDEAYPALLQTRIDSLKWSVTIINAGVSGDTSAGGLTRLAWQLENPPDVLVVALGANDGLRGLPPTMTKSNLTQIIRQAREANSNVSILIAGMQVPPNLGPIFQEEFRDIYPSIAEEMDTELIPFLLEGVGGVTELNQADGIHPNAAGQRRLADTVWEALAPILQERISP